MIIAVEFFIRYLNLRDNLPVPCSLCLEHISGDRKVVTLSEAYRHPELVAVRHWHLSDCGHEQSLPALTEKLIPRTSVFNSEFVIVPNYKLMYYHNPSITSGLNHQNKPMTEDRFSCLYDNSLKMDLHLYYKETWIWREFIRVYLPFMSSFIFDDRDEVTRLRELMIIVMNEQLELWHKWLRWRKYMIDFDGLPGEVTFCREYGDALFDFV